MHNLDANAPHKNEQTQAVTPSSKTTRSHQSNQMPRLKLWRGFLKNPQAVASVVPSSRSLLAELSDLRRLATCSTVVELGPGTGETTATILEQMPSNARLLAIDIVPEFVTMLKRQMTDPRLLSIEADANDLDALLAVNGCDPPEVVISGIPFSHLDDARRYQLTRTIHDVLAPGGEFITYQFRSHVRAFAERLFGPAETTFVPFNLPPLTVYRWTKATAPRRRHARLSVSRNVQ